MDGNFISTDIRYRDRMNSRRRSTSCSPAPTNRGGGGRSRSVGGRSICGAIKEEVGGGAAANCAEGGDGVGLIDEVFEDALEVSAVGNDVGGEEVSGVLEVPGAEGVIGGEVNSAEGDGGVVEVMDTDAGGEVDANNITIEEVVVNIGDNRGEDNSDIKEGGGVVVDEVSGMGGDIGASGGVEGNTGASVGGGSEFGGDGLGGDNIRDNGSPVEPIPLIPRWRLREILAHAEGKCIYTVMEVLLLRVYRAREVLRVLGLVLPFSE